MPKARLPLLIVMLLLPGCASWSEPLPVAASCPPPPPPPAAVIGYASPETNLIEDSGRALLDFRNDLSESLSKASGEPM